MINIGRKKRIFVPIKMDNFIHHIITYMTDYLDILEFMWLSQSTHQIVKNNVKYLFLPYDISLNRLVCDFQEESECVLFPNIESIFFGYIHISIKSPTSLINIHPQTFYKIQQMSKLRECRFYLKFESTEDLDSSEEESPGEITSQNKKIILDFLYVLSSKRKISIDNYLIFLRDMGFLVTSNDQVIPEVSLENGSALVGKERMIMPVLGNEDLSLPLSEGKRKGLRLEYRANIPIISGIDTWPIAPNLLINGRGLSNNNYQASPFLMLIVADLLEHGDIVWEKERYDAYINTNYPLYDPFLKVSGLERIFGKRAMDNIYTNKLGGSVLSFGKYTDKFMIGIYYTSGYIPIVYLNTILNLLTTETFITLYNIKKYKKENQRIIRLCEKLGLYLRSSSILKGLTSADWGFVTNTSLDEIDYINPTAMIGITEEGYNKRKLYVPGVTDHNYGRNSYHNNTKLIESAKLALAKYKKKS